MDDDAREEVFFFFTVEEDIIPVEGIIIINTVIERSYIRIVILSYDETVV